MNNRPFKTRVTVRFVKRDDGGLQAFCDEVNGFYLSGRDPRAVMTDVAPAIEALVKINLEIEVQVSPLGRGLYELIEQPSLPQVPDTQEYVVDYVIERAA